MSLLAEAEALIFGQRETDYGHPRVNWERIRSRWSQHVGFELTINQCIAMMLDLKVARLCQTPDHRDSWLDCAGYVGCYSRINEEEPCEDPNPSFSPHSS